MDANDAASYVQDLAGEDANIIFGAKFDETMTDEATITVCNRIRESSEVCISPGGVSSRYDPNQTVNRRQAVRIVNRVAPTNSYVGTGVTNNASVQRNSIPVTPRPATTAPRQATPTYSGIQRPKQPLSR